MSDKKTIQEALAEVQRLQEENFLKEVFEILEKDGIDINEHYDYLEEAGALDLLKGAAKYGKQGAEYAGHKALDAANYIKGIITGRGSTVITTPGGRSYRQANPKPTNPQPPATPPASSGTSRAGKIGTAIVGGTIGAGLGTVVGDRLAKATKDALSPGKTSDASKTSDGTKPAAETPKQETKPSTPMTFSQAFAAARKAAGEKGAKSTGQFTWTDPKTGKTTVHQTNIKGAGTAAKPEERYVSMGKQTKVDIGGAKSAETPKPAAPEQSAQPPAQRGLPIPPESKVGQSRGSSVPTPPSSGSMFDPNPMGPTDTFKKRDQVGPSTGSFSTESGKRRKMSEASTPIIDMFLKLQEKHALTPNIFEAAKKAKKDHDGDGKVESPKDEVWGSRFKAAKAAGKMEEEEQIDEISKKLAARYGEKAQREIDTVRVYGGPRDTETHNKMKRRGEGVRLAKAKIQAPRVPATEETDYSAPDRAAVTRDNKPSTPAQTTAADKPPFKDMDEEAQIDEVSKKTLGSYIKKAAFKKPYTSIHGAAYDAVSGDPKARKTIQKREKGIERATDRLTKEEQIDEISVGTAYSYAAKKMEQSRKGLLPGDRNPTSKIELKNMTNAANRTDKDYYKQRGFKKMGEEVEFSQAEIDHINSFFEAVAPSRAEPTKGVNPTVRNTDLTDETLEEGRPRKNPTPETTERDARQHIQVQAGRAAGGTVVDFKHDNGKVSKLTPGMGRAITAHLNGLKPAERQEAVKRMHASPEGLKV